MAEVESPPLGDGPELRRRWRASTQGSAGVWGVACRVDGAVQSEAQQGSPRSARLLLGSVLWATLRWVLIASARRTRVQAEIIVGRIDLFKAQDRPIYLNVTKYGKVTDRISDSTLH